MPKSTAAALPALRTLAMKEPCLLIFFFRGVGRGPRNNWLDVGGYLDRDSGFLDPCRDELLKYSLYYCNSYRWPRIKRENCRWRLELCEYFDYDDSIIKKLFASNVLNVVLMWTVSAARTSLGVGSSADAEDVSRWVGIRRAFSCAHWSICYQGASQEAVRDKVCWRHQRGADILWFLNITGIICCEHCADDVILTVLNVITM